MLQNANLITSEFKQIAVDVCHSSLIANGTSSFMLGAVYRNNEFCVFIMRADEPCIL